MEHVSHPPANGESAAPGPSVTQGAPTSSIPLVTSATPIPPGSPAAPAARPGRPAPKNTRRISPAAGAQPHPDATVVQPSPEPVPQDAADLARLGAHVVDGGMDVVVIATRADAVDLCLIDDRPGGGLSERRYRLRGPVRGRWHGHVPGIQPGQRYGLRVHGPWRPEIGLRHNPAKLLLDPYARAIDGSVKLTPAIYPHVVDDEFMPISDQPDPRDSRDDVALGVLLAPRTDVPAPRPRPGHESTVVYEAHVKGLTMLHPDVPEDLRGTYAGLAHPAIIEHLTSLGVTTIELLPIHASMPEPFLHNKGLTNYWGYSTLSFFAPEPSYATAAAQAAGPQAVVDEVRAMVDALHAAGIEVLLDVVYNHTCEGGDWGPSLSLRGLDATGNYLHDPGHPGNFWDTTGCGNSLDFRRTQVVALTLDSLRYWVTEMGVDGFRFDLAVTLGRNGADFSSHHPLFVAMATDPVLSRTTLVAEPWDLGPGGWRTGQFPDPFAEWNDRYRNTVRTFWLADAGANSAGRPGHDLRDLATRLSGSGDLFGHGDFPGGRGPLASVNFLTSHDGFTLADLTTYNHKHNEKNLEDNRDGSNDNRSWNHGVEGPPPAGPDQAEVLLRRRRSMRNLLGTMLVSAGTPMITAGDEFGRTQEGNNNAYCQDNEISWVNWDLANWQEELLTTATYLVGLRAEHVVLRPQRLASGAVPAGDVLPDLSWGDVDGGPLPVSAWHDPATRVLQMLRSGYRLGGRDLLVVFNGSITARDVTLCAGRGRTWELAWDSAWPHPTEHGLKRTELLHAPGSVHTLAPLSMRIYLTR